MAQQDDHPEKRVRRWVALILLTALGLIGPTLVAITPAQAASYTLSVEVQNPSPRVGDELVLEVSTTMPNPIYAVQWKKSTLATDTSKKGAVTIRVPLDAVPLGSQEISISASNADDDLLVVKRPFEKVKLTPTVTFAASSGPWSRPLEIQVAAPDTHVVAKAGVVDAYIDTKTIKSQLMAGTNGMVSYSTTGLMPGTYPVTASFTTWEYDVWGDAPPRDLGVYTITPAQTQTSISLSPASGNVTAGEQVSISYSVDAPQSGVAPVTSAPMVLTARKVGSATTETIATLSAGATSRTYDLTAFAASHVGTWQLKGSTAASGGYAASETPEVSLTVAPANDGTQTLMSLDPITATTPIRGKAIAAAVSVVADDDSSPTGSVKVLVDGVALPPATLSAGRARVDLPVDTLGTHRVVATYGGSGAHQSSTSLERTYEVTKAATRIAIPTPQDVAPGAVLPFTVFAQDSQATPDGTLRVSEGGRELSVSPVAGGSQPGSGIGALTVRADLAPGTHLLDLTYTGNSQTMPSTTQLTVVVRGATTPPPPDGSAATTTSLTLDRDTTTAGGAAVTASASVTVNGGAAPDGPVSVVVDGAVVATKPAGAAAVTFALPVDRAGSHSVVVRYAGSVTQAASESAARTYTVAEAPAAVPVASAIKAMLKKAKKRKLKATVTVTATQAVAGKIQVTQAVKVKKPGKKGTKPTFVTKQKVVGTAMITKVGTTVKVVLTTKKLRKGRHTLTVRYLGSPTVLASTKSFKVRVR